MHSSFNSISHKFHRQEGNISLRMMANDSFLTSGAHWRTGVPRRKICSKVGTIALNQPIPVMCSENAQALNCIKCIENYLYQTSCVHYAILQILLIYTRCGVFFFKPWFNIPCFFYLQLYHVLPSGLLRKFGCSVTDNIPKKELPRATSGSTPCNSLICSTYITNQ